MFQRAGKFPLKSLQKVVKNQFPENQHIFHKDNINAKRRQETYTDAVHGKI